MIKGISRIIFQTNANSPFVAGDEVDLYVDNTTNAFTIYKNGVLITTGPTLGDPSYVQYWKNSPPETVINYSYNPINDDGEVDFLRPDPQYCSTTSLIRFEPQTIFPYVKRIVEENHPSCSVDSVCDVRFVGSPVIVRPSTAIASDGSITVSAVGSFGTIGYTFTKNILYSAITNTSGGFTGLLPGNHTIYAKDSRGCSAEITIELLPENNYATRWRIQYYDRNGWQTRVDIQELDYAGSIIDVKATDVPLEISLRGENTNIFHPVLSTEAIIGLVSETDMQFIDLFTQSDRKFRVVYLKDHGSGLLTKWLGWVTPGLYQERYDSNENYYVTANATDNITTLSEIGFDETHVTGTVSIIKIISAILKKINLDLDIRVACDLYENAFYQSSTLQFQNTGFTSAIAPWDSVHPAKEGATPMTPFVYGSNKITANDGLSRLTEWIVQYPELPQQVWPAGTYVFRITGTNHLTTASVTSRAAIYLGAFDEPINVSNRINEIAIDPPYFPADNTQYVRDISVTLPREYRYLAFQFELGRTTQKINLTIESIEIISIATAISPFHQTYVTVEDTYYTPGGIDEPGEWKSCMDVLTDILKTFGARLYQWDFVWNIDCIYMKSATYTYHLFNSDGDYLLETTRNPVVDFKLRNFDDRWVWVERSQNLEIVSAIGRVDITHDLSKNEFGFKNGGFEDVTFPDRLPGYVESYDNWTLVRNGNTASYGYIASTTDDAIPGNDSKRKMYISTNSDNTVYAEDAYIQSGENPIDFSKSDGIKFSFDYMPIEGDQRGDVHAKFVKFKWSLKVDDYFLQDDGTWTTDDDFEWIETVVEAAQFNKWNTITVTTNCPPVASLTTSTYVVKLMTGTFKANRNIAGVWDITSGANLKAKPTVDLPEGYVVCYQEPFSPSGYNIRWYELEASDDPESSPQVLRPNDYNVSTNQAIWRMVEEFHVRGAVRSSPYIIVPKDVAVSSFDNVTMEFLPSAKEAPDKKLYSLVNNESYKDKIEFSVSIGDAPVDIANSQNIYKNYYKHADGSPTYGWSRLGFIEFQPLLSILAKQYVEHYRKPKFKLTGTFTADVFVGFDSTLKDGSRVFLPMGMTLNDIRNEYTVEIHEFEIVDSDTVNPFGDGEFDTDEFGQSFDI